jgi:hypothetical protein
MNTTKLQQLTEELLHRERDRARRLRGMLSEQLLKTQNRLFEGTMGISQNNHGAGFVPAYLDLHTGRAVESRFADGRPAPVHLLDGLPAAWVAERAPDGRVVRARDGIVAGFLRDGRFYTREQAARTVSH